MTMLIHSDDFKTGSSSSGLWDLGRNLNGTWQVTAQTMDAQAYPWLWAGRNQMVVKSFNPNDINEFVIFGITFNASLGLVTDLNEVATQIQNTMQATFDFQGGLNIWANRTITVSYNSTLQTLLFEIDDDPIDVLWSYENGLTVSSINPSFGLPDDVGDLTNVDLFSVSTRKMVTDPQYLFCYIDQSVTSILTTSLTRPTLIFSTKDSQFTGQQMTIHEITTTLDITICRMHETDSIPLSGSWYLALKKIG